MVILNYPHAVTQLRQDEALSSSKLMNFPTKLGQNKLMIQTLREVAPVTIAFAQNCLAALQVWRKGPLTIQLWLPLLTLWNPIRSLLAAPL